MADPAQEPLDADEALKKRLISRIAVAGVMIVALLGALAIIDALQAPTPPAPKEEPEAVAKAPETEPKAEEKPAEAKPEEPKPEEKTVAAPEQKEPPKPEPPAPAAVPSVPERTVSAAAPAPAPRTGRPLTAPATARPAAIRPSEPSTAAPRIEPEKEIARTPQAASPVARHAPASRPLTQAAESGRQYVVQMGVFNNVANAEELRAKLEMAGIPSQIEARVQVGPFRSRLEAESAREKLRAMGMETGILAAIRR